MLIEFGEVILPRLFEAFRVEHSPRRRAAIVETIWQLRSPSALDFLANALDNTSPEVWKEALDGLVTIGGSDAEKVLRHAIERLGKSPAELDKREWLAEAFDQLRR